MGASRSTVLITGASSGIGKATALWFQSRGWNVAATMRSPDSVPDLQGLENLLPMRLDVTDEASIEVAVAKTLEHFGGIDVLVNNAGYALMGPFEETTSAQIQQQFATNVLGLMATTRAVLPHFRSRRSGVIINVSSVGGRLTFPLYSLYNGTKWAVEGFSESLHYELAPFNIRVKLIEPGPIKTDFYDRSAVRTQHPIADYAALTTRVMARMDAAGETGAPSEEVAAMIFKAATDKRDCLRYVPDKTARGLLTLRRLLPESWFYRFVQRSLMQ
ncbi:MAG TPA: SDR family oxidoreductase [Stenomitos sp.]